MKTVMMRGSEDNGKVATTRDFFDAAMVEEGDASGDEEVGFGAKTELATGTKTPSVKDS